MRLSETKIQEKFEKIPNDLSEEQHFVILAPIESHVNENEKRMWKFKSLKKEQEAHGNMAIWKWACILETATRRAKIK